MKFIHNAGDPCAELDGDPLFPPTSSMMIRGTSGSANVSSTSWLTSTAVSSPRWKLAVAGGSLTNIKTLKESASAQAERMKIALGKVPTVFMYVVPKSEGPMIWELYIKETCDISGQSS